MPPSGSPFARGITYRDDFGLWWPNYDHNPIKCHNKVLLEIDAMDLTIMLCGKRTNVCIQAGGHAGLWPKRLAQHFRKVYTFEPEPDLFDCMTQNLAGIPNIEMHRLALGASNGEALMNPHPSAGSWSVIPNGRVPVQQVTIDSLKVKTCDAILLDIEGYEAEALAGAEQTITKFRPILHLEIWGKKRGSVDHIIAKHGYEFRGQRKSDSIFVPL